MREKIERQFSVPYDPKAAGRTGNGLVQVEN